MTRARWALGVLAIPAAACTLLVSTADLGGEGQAEPAPAPDAARDDAPSAVETAPPAEAGDPSLVGEWRFDDGQGSVARDSSGHGHDAELVGGAAFVADGVRAGAASFSGGDAVAVVAGLDGPLFPRSGTFSVWLRWTSMPTTSQHAILDGWDDDRPHVFFRHANNSPTGELQFALQPVKASYVFVQTFDLGPSQWHHVVFTWDEALREASIFVDATEIRRGAYDAPFAPTSQRGLIGLGFIGQLDEVRLYARALSAAEALALP